MVEQQYTEEEEYEEDNKETFAYADYSGVQLMIQTYYYRMVETFRRYYVNVLKQKDNRQLRQNIQSYIITLNQLLKRYNSIKSDKRIKGILDKLDNFVISQETLSFEGIYECVNIISDAHNVLGLNKIEHIKKDVHKSISGG
jgi:hypothetical protein|tara:strand:+ start:2760 stop:3185 length:426 start_codon:yes stop_codon:yes gene_type:complete